MKWLSILLCSWLFVFGTTSFCIAESCNESPCTLLVYYESRTDVAVNNQNWPKLFRYDHTCNNVNWAFHPAPAGVPIARIEVAKYFRRLGYPRWQQWVLMWKQTYWTTREFADLVKAAADDTTTTDPRVHFDDACPGDKCKAPLAWDPLTATCINQEIAIISDSDTGSPGCKDVPVN